MDIMVAFNTIKVGDILWESRRQKMGNTTMSRMANWQVKVMEIDAEKRRALISWNGNTPHWTYAWNIEKLRRTPSQAR